MATMRWYRVYCIGPDDHFTRGETIYCPSDAEALATAEQRRRDDSRLKLPLARAEGAKNSCLETVGSSCHHCRMVEDQIGANGRSASVSAIPETLLELSRQHLREGEARIARQEELIQELVRDGYVRLLPAAR